MKPFFSRIISFGQRYTDIDLYYVGAGSFWLLFSQGILALVYLLVSLAFANLVPKEIFGNYRYVLSLASLISAFSLTGMNTALTRAVSRGAEGTVKASIPVQIRWGMLMTLVSFIASAYYFFRGNMFLGASMGIAGIFLPVINVFNTYAAVFNGKKLFKHLALNNMFVGVVASVPLLLAIFFLPRSLVFVLVYFVSNAVLAWFVYRRSLRFLNPETVDNESLVYGKHQSLVNAFTVFAQYIDGVLVFHYLGATPLATYFFATLIPLALKGNLKILSTLSLPKFSVGDYHISRKTLLKKMALVGLLLSVGIVAYIAIAPLVFTVFFPEYKNAALFSQVAALGIFGVVSLLPLSLFSAHLKTRKLYYFNISTSLLRVGLVFCGVYFWGLWGAIIAFVAQALVNVFISVFLLLFEKEEKPLLNASQ